MGFVYYICLCFFMFQPILGSYHEQYRIPHVLTEQWESYIFNEKEYVIQNLPVRWEDALIICRGRHNGSLAVLDNIEKAEFIAEALSESQFSIDSVWVGAHRQSAQDPLGYRWVGGTRVELRRTANDIMYNSADKQPVDGHFPYWQNRTHVPVPEDGADCVGFTRMYHDKPVFLDLPCEVDRPFVCEKPAETQFHVVEVKTVRCKTGLYHVYDGKMTWDQAAAYCVLGRMSLAHITTLRCLKKLGITMLKSRPSIETAWIGARGELGKWSWLDDGQDVFQDPGFNEGKTHDWPPMRDRTVKQNGCMQLDRHKAQSPIFLEARCERKMQFICYESKEGYLRKSTESPSDDAYSYILVHQKLFWSHAVENCLKMNGVLAGVDNADVLTQLLLLMGENRDLPIGHIWLSGRLNMTKDVTSDLVTYAWYNPATGIKIPDGRSSQPGVFIPPWLDDDFSTDYPCLNLDRENHLSGLVYGLPCDTPQYSICMIEKNPSRTLRTQSPPTLNITTITTVPGVISENPETYITENYEQ